tara:strand:+ start:1146 stop:1604 length:459 start_codon:yes stop_codon:yes gene_type:complete
MEFLAWTLLVLGIIGAVLPLLPGPLLSAVGLVIYAQSNTMDVERWCYLWAAIGVLFFVGDYLLPGVIAKRGGGSKAASRGATVGLLLGLITGPGMFVGAFAGAFIGEYITTKNTVNSLRSAGFATIGVTIGIMGKLIYTLSAIALVLILMYM